MHKRTRRLLLATVVALFTASSIGSPASANPDPQVHEVLEGMVARGVPGVALRHTADGKPSVVRSGVADVETGEPMPFDGRWRVASLTKSVTATVVLQLVDEHRIALDQPLSTVLPGVVPGAERITVRNLLQHTSGLFDYAQDARFQEPERYVHDRFRPRDLVGIAAAHGPAAQPGQKWSYSNTNYILLGMLVERTEGKPLNEVFDQRVLRPAGMRASYLPVTEQRILGPHATGYHIRPQSTGDPARYPLTDLDPSFAWSAYGLVSDASDMARFYRGLFTGKLLAKPLVDEMVRDVPSGDPIFGGYGLGLESIRLTCGRTLWGHTGSIPGYSSYAFSTVDGREQVVLSLNVFELGNRATPVIHSAADAINLKICHQPYTTPTS